MKLFAFVVVFGMLVSSVSAGCPYMASRHLSGSEQQQEAAVEADGGSSSTWLGQIPGANNMSDPLVKMNDYFHGVYTEVGVEVRPPVYILVEGDYLVLVNGTQRYVEAFTPMEYHDLKMIAHIALATNIILQPDILSGNITLSSRTTERLTEFLALVDNAYSAIAEPRFTAEQLPRQIQIWDLGTAFLTALLDRGTCSLDEFNAFSRAIAPLCLANANEAGAAQVNGLNNVVTAWRAMLGEELWDEVKVVVTTSHMARPQNLVSQYFSRLFNVDIFQSHKFITLESISSEAQALKLLDTHRTDYTVGAAFFNNAYRMHEDLLCAAAKKALDELFPESANTSIGCFPTDTPLQ